MKIQFTNANIINNNYSQTKNDSSKSNRLGYAADLNKSNQTSFTGLSKLLNFFKFKKSAKGEYAALVKKSFNIADKNFRKPSTQNDEELAIVNSKIIAARKKLQNKTT